MVFSIDFQHSLGQRRHAPIVDDEKDGLRRRQSQSVAKPKSNQKKSQHPLLKSRQHKHNFLTGLQ